MDPHRAALCVLLVLVLGVPAGPARAQEAFGKIEGTVVSGLGIPLAGAAVTLSRSGRVPAGSGITDSRGALRFTGLPVGEYSLRVALPGHRPVRVEGVTVALGRTTAVGTLRLEAVALELEELVVLAERPLIDPADPTVGSNIASETFSDLPTGRDFRSIAALSPIAVESHLPDDEANIAGGSGPETAWFIDGVNMTDIYVGATSANLPYNFVREIRVRSAGYAAEFGRSMGGAVDVVTQTGGNRWSAQLFGFYTGDAVTADARYSGTATSSEGFTSYDIGGSVGGPIVRDRLWLFAAYNPSFHRERFRLSGLVPPTDRRMAHLFAGKLTYQPSSRTTVQLTALGDPATGTTVFQSYLWDSVGSLGPVLAEEKEGGLAFSLDATQQLARAVTLEATLSTLSRKDQLLPGTQQGYDEPIYYDLRTGFVEGGFGGLIRTDARRTAGRLHATVALPGHAVKGGVEYEDNYLDYESDYGMEETQGGIERLDDVTWAWYRDYAAADLHNRVWTAFLRDEWRISDRLLINVGMRWEGQVLVGADGEPAQKIMDQWQPRVGFVFQPGAPGRQRIFGSAGRYYEQLPLNILTYYGSAGGFEYTLYPQDPRVDTTGAQRVGNPFAAAIEPRRDLKGQAVDQLSLGVERAIGRGVRVGVQGLYRVLRWAIEDAVNPDSGYGMIGNPGRANLSFTPAAARKYYALLFTFEKPEGARTIWQFSYALARAEGNYEGLYEYQFGYAFPNTGGVFDTPEQYPNSSGLLSSDRTHVFKFNGAFRVNRAVTAGVVASLLSGVARNELGTTSAGYDQFLVPRGGNGRSPWIKDISLRLSYRLPVPASARFRPTLQMDLFHLTNGREAVMMDDKHFTYLDENGAQAGPNPNYGQGRYFQPPRSLRMGMIVDF